MFFCCRGKDSETYEALAMRKTAEFPNESSEFPIDRQLEPEFRERELEMNTYDALLFASCYLEDSSCNRDRWAWLQFFFALFLQCVAVIMQLVLVLLLFATVVERAEDPYQHGLADMIAQVRFGIENRTVLDKDTGAIKLCLEDHTLAGAHAVVILLWLSRMLAEIVQGIDHMMIYFQMSGNYKQERDGVIVNEIIEETMIFGTGKQEGRLLKEKYAIVNVTPALRWFFILALGATRTFVASFLTFTSAKYLIMSGSMANVLLKAVSMQFVVTIDELLFKSFIPKAFARKIKSAHLVYPGRRPSMKSQWSMSMSYVFFTVALMFGLTYGLFPKIREFRDVCRAYYIMFPEERNQIMDPVAACWHALTGMFSRYVPEE